MYFDGISLILCVLCFVFVLFVGINWRIQIKVLDTNSNNPNVNNTLHNKLFHLQTTLSNNNASSTTPNQTVTNLNGSTPTSTGAGIVSTDPTGRKFQSMDQAVRSARAFQQNNAGFNYAIQQGPNNSWTIAPRQATTPVVTDLSSNVAGAAGAQSNAPTSPAC